MSEDDIELTSIKLAILGDGQVGKSSICNTFVGLEFSEETISTIGSAKFEKKLKVGDDKELRVALMDTAGQERFRSAAFKAIRLVKGIALVFSVDNLESFKNIEKWLENINDNMDAPSFVLLGNKTDLEKDKWQVTQEEIDKFRQEKKMTYFATSAKTNTGITEAFTYLANLVYNKAEEKRKNNIVIGKKKIVKKKKCC